MTARLGPAPRPSWLEEAHHGVCRVIAQAFYRRIEVVGLERVPRGVPLVFVANHPNMLIDPLLLSAVLPVPVRFLATIVLWKIWPARPWLWLGAAVPIARAQDVRPVSGRLRPSRHNREVFESCYAALARDMCIGIFPEGISRDEPRLQRIRSGAARLALGAERRHGPLGVLIVPVGLNFEARERFLSRVLVHVGAPIDPRPELEMQARRQRGALTSLTCRVARALEAVTLTYDDWDEARLFERAARVVSRPAATLSESTNLNAVFATSKQLAEVQEWMARAAPQQLAATARVMRQYDDLLEDHGLPDAAPALEREPLRLLPRVARTLGFLLVRLPFVALGAALNWLPYRLSGVLAAATTSDRQSLATHKVVVGTVLFPAAWLAMGAAVGWRYGITAGVCTAMLGPMSGLIALPFVVRRDRMLTRLRAFVLLRRDSDLGRRLVELRAQVALEVRRALALHAARPVDAAAPEPAAAGSAAPLARTPPDLWILRTTSLRRVDGPAPQPVRRPACDAPPPVLS